MSESAAQFTSLSMKRYWPFFVGGLAAPIGAVVLDQWMPLYAAAGLGFFLVFAASMSLFQRSFPAPKRSPVMVLVSALAGGLVAALVTYLSPWR